LYGKPLDEGKVSYAQLIVMVSADCEGTRRTAPQAMSDTDKRLERSSAYVMITRPRGLSSGGAFLFGSCFLRVGDAGIEPVTSAV